MGQCQEKVGAEREMGVQHIPPYGRLGQGAPRRLCVASKMQISCCRERA